MANDSKKRLIASGEVAAAAQVEVREKAVKAVKKEGKMTAKKKVAQADAQATQLEANASIPNTNYIISSPICQIGEMDSLEAMDSFLRARAAENITAAHKNLAQAQREIEGAQTKRSEAIAAKKAEIAQLEQAKKALRPRLQEGIKRAEGVLPDDEATRAVARIIELGALEKKALRQQVSSHKAALKKMVAADEKAAGEEEAKLALLQDEVARIEAAAPDVARDLARAEEARTAGLQAIRLAREGQVEEAAKALEKAQGLGAEDDLLQKAGAEIAKAQEKALVHPMMQKIAACDPERPGALKYLRRLEEEAEKQGIYKNVISAINHQCKLAEAALGNAWRRTRQYAGGLRGARPNCALRVSCGRIEVWARQNEHDNSWVLAEVHRMLKEGWDWGAPEKQVGPQRLPAGAKAV